MAETEKRYWKGLEELTLQPEFVKHANNEFYEELPTNHPSNDGNNGGSNRRDFLKLMGFSVAAASLAACEAPVRHAIPLVVKPEEYDPSVANYYSGTFAEGGEYAAILVKTREGRPIKVEGNKLSSVTAGGTSARVQASVLNLYDKERYKGPMKGGKATTWEELDAELTAKLKEVAASNGAIRLVSNSVLSPTATKAAGEFLAAYPSAKWVKYDSVSAYGIAKANKMSFGVEVIPNYRFDNANVIVSFGADFLGTWLSNIEYSGQWAKNRKLSKSKKTMSRLIVVESNMSLTGSNADVRLPIRASEEGLYLANLYNEVAAATGGAALSVNAKQDAVISKAAMELVENKGASLVVSGSNDPHVQVLVNAINNLLGNYGKTIDLNTPLKLKQGNDEEMAAFVSEVKSGSVGAVIFWNCNPVYDFVGGSELKAGLGSVKVKVSTSDRPNETAVGCEYIAPDHHYLESWSDAEPKKDHYSLGQPTISPLFKTRQAPETLLKLAGKNADYYSYLQGNWKLTMFGMQSEYKSFKDFWNYSLHDGVFEVGRPSLRGVETSAAVKDSTGNIVTSAAVAGPDLDWKVPVQANSYTFSGNLAEVASAISSEYKAGAGVDVVLYETIGIGDGSSANNPWLQEFPDPVTRACWDNYITVPVSWANEKGVKVVEGTTVLLELKAGGKTIKLPAMVQPGQAKNTVGIPLGYGREVAGLSAKNVGKNAMPLARIDEGTVRYWLSNATVEVTNEAYEVAHVQTHHTVMGRTVIQEATLSAYQKDAGAGREIQMIETADGPKKASELSVWLADHKYNNHFWGMAIDLNTCTGCGACVVACQSENNVPVVGKKEVLMRREMHWIRIDRYFSSDAPEGDLKAMEQAGENPDVVFQPLMCQHCNNAPCETVCPVAATTHSSEGLNQMAYNRCIGTRYCANNCPYKVRRFNWFSYPQSKKSGVDNWLTGINFHDGFPHNPANSDLGRMVLNPDVTVRARGVMEKCTMCVQRIQEGKLNAKKEGRRPIDGEIVTACAAACSTGAIVFGDMNDENSRISKSMKEENEARNYRVLDEINTRPSISYLTKIRNVEEKKAKA